MAVVVKMPKLSDTMTEGVVASWLKKVGDKVKSGDILAEIETDKATMEFESFNDGVLLYIGVEKGRAAPVDALLCIIGKEGEDIKNIINDNKNTKVEKIETAKNDSVTKPITNIVVEEQPKQVAQNIPVNSAVTVQKSNGRIKVSPLAKKLAGDKGLNISMLKGTGEGGRIVKRDIDNFNNSYNPVHQVESFNEIEISQMRKTIARRLAESKFSAPHFYLIIDINMDKAIDVRHSIAETFGVKVSFNDLVIKAAASALKEHPNVNSSWLGDRIRYNQHVHMGVAVAVEDGLLVPVVRFADTKTLTQINSEVKTFATRAKEKKLQPQDWEGNTFTISNLGMFGIEEFTAIINPPDACIMAVGAIREVPIIKNGQVVAGNQMKVTLSCDHRVVDGATGSAFLQDFKNYLENPALLLGKHAI